MGSTRFVALRCHLVRNHPHVYGEYPTKASQIRRKLESPPCVWGVLLSAQGVLSANGITPMCMGSTNVPVAYEATDENHPHVYGEYWSIKRQSPAREESPPCVWGVLWAILFLKVYLRITPMCMGSTKAPCKKRIGYQNHPHVYGEYSKNYLIYRHS